MTPIELRPGAAGTPVAVSGGGGTCGRGLRRAVGHRVRPTCSTWPRLRTDLTGSRQQTVTVGQGPIGVATGRGTVWVANAEGGTVSDRCRRRPIRDADLPGRRGPAHGGRVGPGWSTWASGRRRPVRTVAPAPKSQALVVRTEAAGVLVPVAGVVRLAVEPGPGPGGDAGMQRHASSVSSSICSAWDWESLRGDAGATRSYASAPSGTGWPVRRPLPRHARGSGARRLPQRRPPRDLRADGRLPSRG